MAKANKTSKKLMTLSFCGKTNPTETKGNELNQNNYSNFIPISADSWLLIVNSKGKPVTKGEFWR
ncbi:hypothetical protein DM860_016313 [Cuscuta australis]|uniref:Uncharacterized protein n=1 Tax=Cuscuta australis TaxID=267555 RepID=A0A328E8S7_9ASTE|nr:hypothetical protein DM860_016313 [Cuscuta australis]